MEAVDRPGHDALWGWFGLSYAAFLTIPRVLLHEMPDEWQGRLADLLREFDETYYSLELPEMNVQAVGPGNRFMRWPRWLLEYRHPDRETIRACMDSPTVRSHRG